MNSSYKLGSHCCCFWVSRVQKSGILFFSLSSSLWSVCEIFFHVRVSLSKDRLDETADAKRRFRDEDVERESYEKKSRFGHISNPGRFTFESRLEDGAFLYSKQEDKRKRLAK